MAEKIPDKTVAEQILDTLAVPGSTSREMMVQAMKMYRGEDFNGDQILDNLAKKEFTSPDEFLTELETTTGIPKRVTSSVLGASAGAVMGVGAGPVGAAIGALAGGLVGATSEFGANLMTDIATDPIGFLFKPASAVAKTTKAKRIARVSKVAQRKLQKGAKLSFEEGKIMDALGKDAFRLAFKGIADSPDDIARAATGATLGLMAIDPDEEDPISSSIARIAALTAAGPSATKSVRSLAEMTNVKMTEFVDAYKIKALKDRLPEGIFDQMTPLQAKEIARKASESREFREAFITFAEKEDALMQFAADEFKKQADDLMGKGELNVDNYDQFLDGRLRELQRVRVNMFSAQVFNREEFFQSALRNNAEEVIDSYTAANSRPAQLKINEKVVDVIGSDLRKVLPDGSYEIPTEALYKLFDDKKLNTILSKATADANAFAYGNIFNLAQKDKAMANIMREVPKMNKELVDYYNKAWKAKKGDGFQGLEGFHFWAYDSGRANRFADTFVNAKEGFVKRGEVDVKTFVDDIPEGLEDFWKYKIAETQRAGSAFAGRFLAQKELDARKILSQITKAQTESTSIRKIYENIERYRGGEIPFNEMLNDNGQIAMNIYDQWLN